MGSSVQQILEIVAKFKDSASGPMTKVAASASAAEKSLAAMTQRLEFQARAADLAAKSLNSTQIAYDKNAAAIRKVESDLAKFTTTEQRNAQAAQQLQQQLDKLGTAKGKTGQAAKQLQAAIDKLTASKNQSGKAAQSLQSQLDKLTTTNDRLAQSVDRKKLALDKSIASIVKTRDEAARMGTALNQQADTVGKSGSAFTGLVGKLGALGAAYMSVSALAGKAAEGFTLSATLDQNRRTLGTLFQDMERGNKVFEDAIAFGQKYGFTQKEMGSSISAAASILKNSNQTTEKTLEVMARLASLNPAEGIEGATFAIKELASGDILSLVERFNLSKTAANEMKDAIAAGADPIMVLDAALSQMGVSTQVLADRMEGSNGALLRNKLAAENTTLGLGRLLEAFGATALLEAFSAGLNTIADGLNYVAANTTAFLGQAAAMEATIATGTAAIIARGGAYDDYAARMAAVGLAAQTLTEAEYAQVAAMLANGAAADVAIASVQNLSASSETLQGAFFKTRDGAYASAEAQQALTDKVISLGSATPETSAAVVALLDELSNGGDVDTFAEAIENLSINHEYATSTSFGYADAQIVANDAIAAGIDPVDALTFSLMGLTDEQYNDINAKLEASAAADELARFEQDLAFAVQQSGDSAAGAAQQAFFLTSAYGGEFNQVLALINATRALNRERAGLSGESVGRSVGGSMPGLAAMAPYRAEKAAEAAAARAPKRSGGGSRGGSGGSSGGGKPKESPEVKAAEKTARELEKVQDKIDKATKSYQDKAESAAQKHADKLAQIEADYHAKVLAATEQFNEDKFQSQLSFEQGLIDLDEDLYQAALAAGDQYWAESQAMAQAGHAEQAAEYLAAGQALADIEAQNAQELRDLRAEIAAEEDEAERARLEQRLARLAETNAQEEQLARDKVEAVKNGGDAIEQERDQAIEQEQADYSDAQDSLKAAFADTMTDIKDSYSDMGEAARATADAIVAAAERAAAALNSIPSGAGGGGGEGEGSSEGGGESAEGRAVGGPVRRNKPYMVGEKGPELIIPEQNGFVLTADQTSRRMAELDALASAGRSTMPGIASPMMARVSGGQMGGSVSNSSVSNSTFAPTVSIDMRGASGPVAAAKAELVGVIRQELEAFNKRVGRSGFNQKRSG